MYLRFKRQLRKFGVDLTVYPYDSPAKKPHYHYVGGVRVSEDDESKPEPVNLHEPVVPANSQSSFMMQLLNGGALSKVDLLWFSNHVYPKGTIVEVPSQPGQKYRVTNFSNYQGYSDVIIYELEGDDKHPDGK